MIKNFTNNFANFLRSLAGFLLFVAAERLLETMLFIALATILGAEVAGILVMVAAVYCIFTGVYGLILAYCCGVVDRACSWAANTFKGLRVRVTPSFA